MDILDQDFPTLLCNLLSGDEESSDFTVRPHIRVVGDGSMQMTEYAGEDGSSRFVAQHLMVDTGGDEPTKFVFPFEIEAESASEAFDRVREQVRQVEEGLKEATGGQLISVEEFQALQQQPSPSPQQQAPPQAPPETEDAEPEQEPEDEEPSRIVDLQSLANLRG